VARPAKRTPIAPGTDLADIREALQERPLYFHGTKASFAIGSSVVPRNICNGAPTKGPLEPGAAPHPEADKWVFVTTRLAFAWAYAWKSGGAGPPVVLVVQPAKDLQLDLEHSLEMKAYRCTSAKVLLIDDEPLITEEQAEAGWKTFPAD